MQLFTSLSPTELPPEPTGPDGEIRAIDIAVVIDVLRATTVATTAMANGAAAIVTCSDIDQAKTLAAANAPALLCGERGCRPIEGFDLGNSPTEYSPAVVARRTLVMTTTNGTRAVAASSAARRVFLGSFLNLSAVVRAIETSSIVHLVCAGTDGHVTGEDALLAGAIASLLLASDPSVTVCDTTAIAMAWWTDAVGSMDPQRLAAAIANTRGGRNLIRVGYGDDFTQCTAIDSINIVPQRTSTSPTTFRV